MAELPVPNDFREMAPGKNRNQLAEKYRVSPITIAKWAGRVGINLARKCGRCQLNFNSEDKTRRACDNCFGETWTKKRVCDKCEELKLLSRFPEGSRTCNPCTAVINASRWTMPASGTLNGPLGQLGREYRVERWMERACGY
jgi:hypothetical protein